MSRRYGVRFARLAIAISVVAMAALIVAAGAAAKPIATAPLKTPMPKAESIPLATNTFADPLPLGPSLPVVIVVLAVAALMTGVYLMISRGPGAARRVRELHFTDGQGEQAPSAGGPAGRAA